MGFALTDRIPPMLIRIRICIETPQILKFWQM
jgi:hypothetical protein